MAILAVLLYVALWLLAVVSPPQILAGLWKAFTKAGHPGWAALIPFYNIVIICRIGGKPGWWAEAVIGLPMGCILLLLYGETTALLIVGLCLFIMSLFMGLLMWASFAEAYRKSMKFTLGLIFLPFIFLPILGFGRSKHVGSTQPILLRDLFVDVFLNLTRKKMRTALTMVGVVIGAVAVVTTVSLGHGLSAFLDQQVRAVANPLTVEAWPKKGGSPDKVARSMFKSIGRAPAEIKKDKEDEFMGALEIKTVEDEMMKKLKQIEGVDRVRPKVFVLARSFQLNGDPREFDAIVVPWIDAGPQVLSKGSVFSDDNATECIVSEAYLESLRTINRTDPIWKDVPEEEIKALEGIVDPKDLIGKTITIRVVKHPMLALAGQGNMDMSAFDDLRGLLFLLRNPPQDFQLFLTELFLKLRELQNSEAIKAMSESEEEPIAFEAKVVGIAKKGLLTNIIYVPDEFAAEMGRVLFDNPDMYTEKNWGMGVVLLAKDKADVPRIKTEVKEMGFRAHTMEDIIGKLHAFFSTLQSVLVIFGGIAFFVATFSIVNTLLMAVMERKREIGVLQALGATRAHIMKIFASEAAAIGLLGGILGGLAGWLLIQGGNDFAHYKWGHIIASADIFVMPVWLVPALLIFTTLLGLGAGVYPAYRASRLDPVAALRYE